MNIASIDVGMKYLGFCLFRVENDSFKIVKWDTINLCNEKIYKCCGKTKKGEPCDKTARFFPPCLNVCSFGFCLRFSKLIKAGMVLTFVYSDVFNIIVFLV